MTGPFFRFITIGLNFLMGGYVLLLAPRRRVNQLFAAILIVPRLAVIVTLAGIRLESAPIARTAAYAGLLSDSFMLAAMMHFALIYPKRTRLSLRTFKSGLFFGLILFDLIAVVIIGSQEATSLWQMVGLPWMLYGLIVTVLRPRDLPRDQFGQIAITGALLSLLLASLLSAAILPEWWYEINIPLNIVVAIGVVLYMRRLRAGRGAFITPTRWAEWGRWQVMAIYAVLMDFTLMLILFTGLTVNEVDKYEYVASLGEGSGIWLGIVQTTSIALVLLILGENYYRVPRDNRRQRQQMLVLLFGFGIYYALSISDTIVGGALKVNLEWLGLLLPLTLSATVGLAIVRYRFLDTAMDTVAAIVNSTLQLDEVLTLILEQLDAVIEFTTSGIILLEGDRLKVRAHTDQSLLGLSLPITTDAATRDILDEKQPLLVNDVRHKPREFFPLTRHEQIPPRSLIGVPLAARNQVIGILSIGHYEPHRYCAHDLETITPFAHQVAIAVDNARLYEAQIRRAAALAQAQKLSAAISATLHLEQVLHIAAVELIALFHIDHSGIVLFDQAKEKGALMEEYPATGAIGIEFELNYPAVRELIETQQPIAVTDLENDARMGDERAPLLELGIRSVLLAPLVVQGEVIGSLGLDAMQQRRYWAAEDLDLCRIVSAQIAGAVANAQAYEQEQRARRLADTLRKVSNVVGSTLDLDEVLHRILEELNNVLPYDGAAVWWRDGDRLYMRARRGPVRDEELKRGLPIDKYLTLRQVVTTGEPMIVSDTTTDARWVKATDEPIKSWVGMPLMVKGQVAGMLSIKGYTPNMYSAADLPLVNAFATQVAIAVENARLYEVEVKQVEQELEIARRTQMSLLPAAAPDVPPFEIAGYSLPAKEVGGDFFQYYPLADGKFGVAVGDVSGKGMNAALMMAVTTGTLDTVMRQTAAPSALLAQVNAVLTPRGRRSKLNSACCIAIFDTQSHIMHTANAGFIAPLLRRGDRCELVDVGGLPLGVIENVMYTEQRVAFDAGDLFIFCSDGIVEAMNERGELYGFERLLARVREMPTNRDFSAPAVIEWILRDVRGFVGGAEQHDDMTLVVIKVTERT